MPFSILISESDNAWEKEISNFLLTQNYKVELVASGKELQLKVYKSKCYAVILDADTKHHSGLEVLRYLRLNAPSVKVILTFRDRARFQSFGLTENELTKLGASDILVRPYSLDQMLHSLEGDKQFEAWKDVKQKEVGESKPEEVVDEKDEEFTRIKIQDFYSGNTTIFDHYIRLGPNKYVKILHKGDFIDKERVKRYAEDKQVSHFYFKTKERSIYINFINTLLHKLSKTSKPGLTERKVKTAKNVAEKYIEEVYTVGLKPQLIEEGKKTCENIYEIIQRDPNIHDLLRMYEDYDPPAYTHLFLTCFMANIICKNLDWPTRRTTELIGFGALLHDIGKLKLPNEIRDTDVTMLDDSQYELYKQHPRLGAEMLQKYPSIPEPVRQIVNQHHESLDGQGFPNGLTGFRIYPLARIVGLADEFSNTIVKAKVPPIKGLRILLENKAKVSKFDPLAIRALIQAFIKDKE